MEAREPKHVNGRRVVVLGGGLAGIVAALDCADGGAQVILLEVRPRLGGAAYSFEREGLWLDNGQHVFLRCCTAYRALLERLGSRARVSIQARLEIPVLSPGMKPMMLRRSTLPAPLHLAGALACYRHLSLRGRVGVARAALALSRLDLNEVSARERLDRHTLGEWLAEHGQGPGSVAALWDLIALPTLNLRAAEGSLALGAFVLQTGLLDGNDAGDIGFHLRPLQETLGDPAERALRQAGVEVRLGVRAEAVDRAGTLGVRAEAVDRAGTLRVLAGGEELQADAVICALPHERAGGLLAPLLGARAERWEGLGASPIINVHIVYDRCVCEQDFAAGVGTPVQYLFDRSDAAGLSNGGQYLAISLSGAVAEMGLAADVLCERYVEAMGELFPKAREAKVQSVYVSREHAATFAPRPGTGRLRPAARTEVEGLVLAGAWTDTGWPATLESAVLSGHAAALEALR
ncbi:MAG: hydroxysqualene dehydroxylase HpnE [Solirubrobacteraceae bacterium]